MDWLFETTDPRGVTIRLSRKKWDNKIIRKAVMIDRLDLVRSAIEAPDIGVYQDKDFADRAVYYKKWPGARHYVKVVARVKGNPPVGEIISAFPQTGGKSGEKLIWPRSQG